MWHTYRQTYFSSEADEHKNRQSQKQTFIEEKIPDYGEVDEFFDRIVEQKVRVVVLLEKICLEEPNVSERYKYYWQPSSDDAEDKKKYKIIMKKAENRGNYKFISLMIEWYESGKMVHNFDVFNYTLVSEDVPSRVETFTDFLNDVRIANCPIYIPTHPLAPIVIHSDGGVGLAGLISVIEIGMDMIQFCGDPRNIQKVIADNVQSAPSMMHINQEQMVFCVKVFDMYASKVGMKLD